MRGLNGLPGLFSTLLLPLTLAAASAAANPSTEPIQTSALELPNARSIDPVVDDMFPRWISVRTYLNGEHPGDPAMAELTAWARSISDEPVTTKLRAINQKVNNLLSYASDSQLWHETDYWETPGEAVERGAYTYPMNWSASASVSTTDSTPAASSSVRVTAADSNAREILRPASAAVSEDAAEPAVEADTPAIHATAVAAPIEAVPFPPAKPVRWSKSNERQATAVAADDPTPERRLFGSSIGGTLDQLVSYLLQ